jgi:hypothetical protein
MTRDEEIEFQIKAFKLWEGLIQCEHYKSFLDADVFINACMVGKGIIKNPSLLMCGDKS